MEENRWREMLKALGLTQRELAESIGLDRGYLSRIVNGRVEGTERVYVLVEQVHGIRRAWLRGGDGPMRTEEALTSDQRRLLALVEELDENEARAVLALHPLPTRRGAAQVASPSPRRASPSAMPDTLRLPASAPRNTRILGRHY